MKYILLVLTMSMYTQLSYAQHNNVVQESNSDKKQKDTGSNGKPIRTYDFSQLTRGRKLYLQYCAECHGKNAEGAPNWQQKNPEGKYPPPPLNGTGHAWHHPMKALRMTIRNGTQKIGGNMPGWGGKLSQQDIDDIIAWFQGEWPDEIYRAWERQNQKYKKK